MADDMTIWASERAAEIIRRHGEAFALAIRRGDPKAVTNATLALKEAMARAFVEAYDVGAAAALEIA